MASAMCMDSTFSEPARSAMVRATFSMREYARADSERRSMALLRRRNPASSGTAYLCIMLSVICALQCISLKSLYRSSCIARAAMTRRRISLLGSPGFVVDMSLNGTGCISHCMSMRSRSGPDILFMYRWI